MEKIRFNASKIQNTVNYILYYAITGITIHLNEFVSLTNKILLINLLLNIGVACFSSQLSNFPSNLIYGSTK